MGRSLWTAADARVGLYLGLRIEPDQGSGADEGVRPTLDLSRESRGRTLTHFLYAPTVAGAARTPTLKSSDASILNHSSAPRNKNAAIGTKGAS